jgi:hydrogenase nickel incorporation protein HypA/HybF
VHEFSIAEALAAQVARHAPPGRVVGVEMRVGPLRGIEPEALRMCWEAVTHDTPLEGAVLEVESLPWSITCEGCGRSWSSDVPFVSCACGDANTRPTGGDELGLVAITVEDAEEAA